MNGTPPLWKPLPTKLRAYQCLHALNRGFEITLHRLEQLEEVGLFRLEFLNAYKVMLEHVRAQANEELMSTLRDYEQKESARFDRMEREWERQNSDPDDVFFGVQDRKREIREQIKELQNALKRQKSRKSR